jgi:hypothetical protein
MLARTAGPGTEGSDAGSGLGGGFSNAGGFDWEGAATGIFTVFVMTIAGWLISVAGNVVVIAWVVLVVIVWVAVFVRV